MMMMRQLPFSSVFELTCPHLSLLEDIYSVINQLCVFNKECSEMLIGTSGEQGRRSQLLLGCDHHHLKQTQTQSHFSHAA